MEKDGYKRYKKVIDKCVGECNESNLVKTLDDGTMHYVLENGLHVYIKKTRNVGHDIIKVSTHELHSIEKTEGLQNVQESYLESEIYHYPSVSFSIREYTTGEYPTEKAFVQYNFNEIQEKLLYSLPKTFKKYDYHREKVELEDDFEEKYDVEKVLEYVIASEDMSPEVRQMYEKALEQYRDLMLTFEKKKADISVGEEISEDGKKAKLISEIKELIDEDKEIDVKIEEKSKDKKSEKTDEQK